MEKHEKIFKRFMKELNDNEINGVNKNLVKQNKRDDTETFPTVCEVTQETSIKDICFAISEVK